MKRISWIAVGVLGALSFVTARSVVADEPSTKSEAEGARHFAEIAKVLQSPRCQNCHPSGDAPLHGDSGAAHSMNVSRKSPVAGLKCTTCHRGENQEELHSPPGVPGWRMPPDETRMVFQGLSAGDLCARLKDVTKNGGRSLDALREHMEHDPLVLWAWSPGPGRTKPPITHDAFVTHVKGWVAAGGPCPK